MNTIGFIPTIDGYPLSRELANLVRAERDFTIAKVDYLTGKSSRSRLTTARVNLRLCVSAYATMVDEEETFSEVPTERA